MNSLYHVKLPHRDETKEFQFSLALIAAHFTFSYSHAAGFKVNVRTDDAACIREFSVLLHRLKAQATNGIISEILPEIGFVPALPVERKTIRQLWDETPWGQAILNPSYQAFCECLERETRFSLEEISSVIPVNLWQLTPNEASAQVIAYAARMKRANPNHFKEIWAERTKAFFA
jgi:hypothetical protein